jgi:predicted site-specific integrase-resolvase
VVAVEIPQTSFLNEQRRGMKQLLQLVTEQAIEVLLIESPERLVRISCGIWEKHSTGRACAWKCSVRPGRVSRPQSWCRTRLSMVTAFAERLYGQRAEGVKAALKAYEEGSDGTGRTDQQAGA